MSEERGRGEEEGKDGAEPVDKVSKPPFRPIVINLFRRASPWSHSARFARAFLFVLSPTEKPIHRLVDKVLYKDSGVGNKLIDTSDQTSGFLRFYFNL